MPLTQCRPGRLLLVAAFLLRTGEGAGAGDVQIAPFVGLQYGGALDSSSTGRRATIGAGLQYGLTVDVQIAQRFGVELLLSRQETDPATGPQVGLAVERYRPASARRGTGRVRFRGAFLLGLTRPVPDGFAAHERFTAAVGLGVRTSLSLRFGVRADVRGYYAVVTSGGAIAGVNGSCLLAFGGSGIWQGDVTAALVLTL